MSRDVVGRRETATRPPRRRDTGDRAIGQSGIYRLFKAAPSSFLNKASWKCVTRSTLRISPVKMSSKENNSEVAVDKVTENNEKAGGDAKSEVKGTKRPSESKGEEAKKQKKEENGEEDDVEDEEDVEGEEEEEEEELPEGEEELDEGEEEEEDEGEGEGEGDDDEEDA